MTNSKKKRYQFWINLILIVMTLTIILPFFAGIYFIHHG